MEQTPTLITQDYLRKNNITTYRMAKDLGMGNAALAGILKGRTSPRMGTARRIVSYLGLTLDNVMFLAEIKEKVG